jgi:PilZ domain-containing protein
VWRNLLNKPSENVATPAFAHQRKYRRFPLRYPVRLTCCAGDQEYELETISENVSMGGLLLKAASPAPPGTAVTFMLTVETGAVRRPIQLGGEGEIVRAQRLPQNAGFLIAVKCKQPVYEIQNVFQSPTSPTRPI